MKRALWILGAVIVFDFAVTILGQPVGYWRDPRLAGEGNAFFRWFMLRGPWCYFAFIAGYTAGVVAFVRALPVPSAYVVGIVFVLSHYFAASTWLMFRFHLGMTGPAVYAAVIAAAVVPIVRAGAPAGVHRTC